MHCCSHIIASGLLWLQCCTQPFMGYYFVQSLICHKLPGDWSRELHGYENCIRDHPQPWTIIYPSVSVLVKIPNANYKEFLRSIAIAQSLEHGAKIDCFTEIKLRVCNFATRLYRIGVRTNCMVHRSHRRRVAYILVMRCSHFQSSQFHIRGCN